MRTSTRTNTNDRGETPRGTPAGRRIFFLLLPRIHLLDLAGPAQVFYEARDLGGSYEVHFCAATEEIASAQGLRFCRLEPLPERTGSGDLIIVPGMDSKHLGEDDHAPLSWLWNVSASGAEIASICSGAFVLARAGLLDGRRCATHWKVTDRLEAEHPGALVLRNRLFVRDGSILSSAGVASGIDLALHLVEEHHGPLVAARVARELVVYMRRNGDRDQSSLYLDYRTHLNPGVHRVQDHMVSHPEKNPTIEELALTAGMSSRNLTRQFRRATGITLKEYSTRLKLEVAGGLLRNPAWTIERVASECGFRDPKQLRRIWKREFGRTPSMWKKEDH